ncbi:MAG: hypothetical protein AVDCRST_MAG89-1481, partial [uncultured Gemmatimonadetes bacterium]
GRGDDDRLRGVSNAAVQSQAALSPGPLSRKRARGRIRLHFGGWGCDVIPTDRPRRPDPYDV